jgi:hypothetical protein
MLRSLDPDADPNPCSDPGIFPKPYHSDSKIRSAFVEPVRDCILVLKRFFYNNNGPRSGYGSGSEPMFGSGYRSKNGTYGFQIRVSDPY